MSDVKTGWWASKSKGAKAGIVIGSIVVIAGISYLIYYLNTKDDKPADTGGGRDEADRPDRDGTDTTHNETTTGTGIETNNSGNAGNTSSSVNNSSLPNGGSGCAVIRSAFDRNYDYVRCASVWYTKSKENPATPAIKGTIPNWKSLSENKPASDRLTVAFPNG